MILNVTQFTTTPGARLRTQGAFSGEEFRQDYLTPFYTAAKENKEKLTVNLDGVYGYASSFLAEAFGGIVHYMDVDAATDFVDRVEIVCYEEPYLVHDVKEYMENALNAKLKLLLNPTSAATVKIGDRVRVLRKKSANYFRMGEVTSTTYHPHNGKYMNWYDVQFTSEQLRTTHEWFCDQELEVLASEEEMISLY